MRTYCEEAIEDYMGVSLKRRVCTMINVLKIAIILENFRGQLPLYMLVVNLIAQPSVVSEVGVGVSRVVVVGMNGAGRSRGVGRGVSGRWLRH